MRRWLSKLFLKFYKQAKIQENLSTHVYMKIYVYVCPNQTIFYLCIQVRLMLWDTAGQEEFDALTKSYYRGAQVSWVFSISLRYEYVDIMTHMKDIDNRLGNCLSSRLFLPPFISPKIVFAKEIHNFFPRLVSLHSQPQTVPRCSQSGNGGKRWKSPFFLSQFAVFWCFAIFQIKQNFPRKSKEPKTIKTDVGIQQVFVCPAGVVTSPDSKSMIWNGTKIWNSMLGIWAVAGTTGRSQSNRRSWAN